MKKILAAVMVLLIICLIPLSVSAEEEENFNSDAFTAFSNLSVAWAEKGYDMYPEYVGGVYFADNGNLVVALCDDTDAHRNEVKNLSGAPEVVEFATVKYSYDELYAVQEEIMYNCDNGNYNFLVNFASIAEDKNLVEVSVGSSELAVAESYFASIYGDKVSIYGGYDTEDGIDYDDTDGAETRGDKINATKNLRLYINIGAIAVFIAAVFAVTFLSQKKASSSKRRYRK